MGFRTGLAAMAAMLLTPPVIAAENFAMPDAARVFRVEWQSRPNGDGAVVDGYVFNDSGIIAERVRLLVEGLDLAGQVTSQTIVYARHTQPYTSTYFWSRAPAAAHTYRVSVLSYDRIEAPSNLR
jgi:hypothetical protein